MTSDPDDAELIARSLDGDADAFVEVARRHEVAVGAYLARRVGRELAEDLLGEVWVAALASRATYDRSFPDAGPWLFGVAHNTLRRHWRSGRTEKLLADVTDLAPSWDPWTAVDDRVAAEPVLRRALALLKPQQREIVTLVAWEDPPHRRWGRRRTIGFGAAALVAASAATALVVSSTSNPSESSDQTVTVTATTNPILTKLVADISPLRPDANGNATLTIRNKSQSSAQVGDFGIDLRADDGTYYWGVVKSNLRKAVAHKRGGDDHYKRNIAVALYAVKGDTDTARTRMSVVHLPPGSPPEDGALTPAVIEVLKAKAKAAGKKYVQPKPKTPAEKKEITDNRIWMNTTGALVAAPGDPRVRAGALRILATMPKVKVAKTTTAGRPTLTLTDRWTTGADSVEKLVIDAHTGQPISMFSGGSDMKSVTIYYHNTRVMISDIAAGKF